MVATGGREAENTVEKEENKSPRSWKISISKRENVREVEHFDSFRLDNILLVLKVITGNECKLRGSCMQIHVNLYENQHIPSVSWQVTQCLCALVTVYD